MRAIIESYKKLFGSFSSFWELFGNFSFFLETFWKLFGNRLFADALGGK
jgi:hypothetical protein